VALVAERLIVRYERGLQEALEDTAMLKAIKVGERSPLTSRAKVFQALTRAA
jgi:hypothetical protein